MKNIVSRHYLRRRARAKAKELSRWPVHGEPAYVFTVVKAHRGPYRWYVVANRR